MINREKMESIFLFLVIVEVLFYAAGRITNVRYGELIGMRIFLNVCIAVLIVMCLIMNFLGSAMFLAAVLLLFELMPKSWLCGKKAEN